MTIPLDTALHDLQAAHGAAFADEAATQPRAEHFGDPRGEYGAARDGAALFDVSDRAQIELSGNDRHKFLHNFCTNDIKRLAPGQGCEAFITNIKGRILAHVFVFAAPDSLWLETVAGAEEGLLAHLDRYLIAEDVQLHGRTSAYGELFVSGAQAAGVLSAIGVDAAALGASNQTTVNGDRDSHMVRRVDLLGAPGYLVSAPRDRLPELWRTLRDHAARPAGAAAFHALRIEAGMPLYGRDLCDENLAQEAGRTSQAISFTKGCYLGQEPIARIDALGHINRELRGLSLAAGDVPDPGATVVAGDDSQPIGSVTSSALSYADGAPVALALLRSAWTPPETQVLVQSGAAVVPAKVFWPARQVR